MGSLCAGLFAIMLQVSNARVKSNFKILPLYPSHVVTHRGRGGSASLDIHQDKKKTLVFIEYRTVAFHLSNVIILVAGHFSGKRGRNPSIHSSHAVSTGVKVISIEMTNPTDLGPVK